MTDMTLREYYAGQALTGFVQSIALSHMQAGGIGTDHEQLAKEVLNLWNLMGSNCVEAADKVIDALKESHTVNNAQEAERKEG